MKFPKLKLQGILKTPPKGMVPEEENPLKTVETVKTPAQKFNSIKRTLGTDRNLTKKFKV